MPFPTGGVCSSQVGSLTSGLPGRVCSGNVTNLELLSTPTISLTINLTNLILLLIGFYKIAKANTGFTVDFNSTVLQKVRTTTEK